MWPFNLDWIRLLDQCQALEARRAGLKPTGPALCQQEYDPRAYDAWSFKSFSNGGVFPLPTVDLGVTGRKDGARRTSTTELNRK